MCWLFRGTSGESGLHASQLTLARPTTPDLYLQEDFVARLFRLLTTSDRERLLEFGWVSCHLFKFYIGIGY